MFALMTGGVPANKVDAGSTGFDMQMFQPVRGLNGGVSRGILNQRRGEENEHLDNLVRDSVSSLDYRFLGVPRSRGTHPLAAHLRGDFPDPAFCDGKKRRLSTVLKRA
jgi:hypothetical protein